MRDKVVLGDQSSKYWEEDQRLGDFLVFHHQGIK
jgi:hypothetical protein